MMKPVGKGGINGCQAVPRVGSPGDLWGRPLRSVESPGEGGSRALKLEWAGNSIMAIVNSPHSCGLDLGPHTGCPPGVRKCSFWKGGRKD